MVKTPATRLVLAVLIALAAAPSAKPAADWTYASQNPREFSYPIPIAINRTIYIFGDINNAEIITPVPPTFNSLWTLDADTLKWSRFNVHGQIPPRRLGYCLAFMKNKIYMFGGYSTQLLRDFYRLDISRRKWEYIVPFNDADGAPERFFHECFSWSNEVYVFGGFSPYGRKDMWKYNTERNMWIPIQSPPNAPVRTKTNVLLYNDCILMLGGSDTYGRIDSVLWSYNLTSSVWSILASFPNLPPRADAGATILNGKLYSYGGSPFFTSQTPYSDLVVIDLVLLNSTLHEKYTPVTSQLQFPINQPPARVFNRLTSVDKRIFLIGGSNSCIQNDFWVYDTVASRWIGSSLSSYPLGRSSSNIAKVSENQIAIFGGNICQHIDQYINDLWFFDTDKFSWQRVVQESNCTSYMYDCAPPVSNAVFSYYDGSLFLIGGYINSIDKTNPVSRIFRIDSKKMAKPSSSKKFFGACRAQVTCFICF